MWLPTQWPLEGSPCGVQSFFVTSGWAVNTWHNHLPSSLIPAPQENCQNLCYSSSWAILVKLGWASPMAQGKVLPHVFIALQPCFQGTQLLWNIIHLETCAILFTDSTFIYNYLQPLVLNLHLCHLSLQLLGAPRNNFICRWLSSKSGHF